MKIPAMSSVVPMMSDALQKIVNPQPEQEAIHAAELSKQIYDASLTYGSPNGALKRAVAECKLTVSRRADELLKKDQQP